jgi:hypothetical protein
MNQTPENSPQPLNRRDAIRRVSAWLGAITFTGGSGLLAAAEKALLTGGAPGQFTLEEIAFLDEIAETILPATKTPGAKAAKTGAFMALMVTDAYGGEDRKIFQDGMHEVEAAMQAAHLVSFMSATPAQRLTLLTELDREQKRVMDAREAANFGVARKDGRVPAHYFRMMKELAMLGFYTSEVGCTQVLRYIETPGRFDPCLPYKPGEPAWALHA